jgi:hypothetical protein
MGRHSTTGDDRRTALGEALRALFRSLQARPVPDTIRSVVDQLEERQSEAPKKTASR